VDETINWIAVTDSVPDDDTTVLLFCPDAGEPVWLGYRDDEHWHFVDSIKVTYAVTHWAEMPEGPKR
jgi:hypothetical protein